MFSSKRLKSSILAQNWYDMAHLNKNIPPFEILSHKSNNHIQKVGKHGTHFKGLFLNYGLQLPY